MARFRSFERRTRGVDGREYTWLQYDPTFQPKLPCGAVRGDVTRQEYCAAHHVPKYFYIDEEWTCIQRGASFTFRGADRAIAASRKAVEEGLASPEPLYWEGASPRIRRPAGESAPGEKARLKYAHASKRRDLHARLPTRRRHV